MEQSFKPKHALIVTAMTAAGAALYRWRGHGSKYKKYFPRPFNQIAFALPYALVAWAATSNWWIAGAVLFVSTLGLVTGHGKFMDLGHTLRESEDETLEFSIKFLEGRISNYWYDALGLAVTGLAVTVPAGIALANPVLSLTGILKAPAYMIGRKWGPAGKETEVGEWLTGAFLWGSLAAVYAFTL